MLCDFCSAPAATWIHPAESFRASELTESQGDWAACQECHELIESDHRALLVERSVQLHMSRYPFLQETEGRKYVTQTFQRFFANRRGPARSDRQLRSVYDRR